VKFGKRERKHAGTFTGVGESKKRKKKKRLSFYLAKRMAYGGQVLKNGLSKEKKGENCGAKKQQERDLVSKILIGKGIIWRKKCVLGSHCVGRCQTD